MKYCEKCGTELRDDAVCCVSCGCSVKKSPNQGLTTATKILMLVGCVVGGIDCIISLAWRIPITVSYFKKLNRGEEISVAFKICSLIFVSKIGGILMLCNN